MLNVHQATHLDVWSFEPMSLYFESHIKPVKTISESFMSHVTTYVIDTRIHTLFTKTFLHYSTNASKPRHNIQSSQEHSWGGRCLVIVFKEVIYECKYRCFTTRWDNTKTILDLVSKNLKRKNNNTFYLQCFTFKKHLKVLHETTSRQKVWRCVTEQWLKGLEDWIFQHKASSAFVMFGSVLQ